jgi:hypothetical protein
MKNPCHACERAQLDKDECSLDCKHRYDYCRHLGIPTGEDASPRRDAASNYRTKSHNSVAERPPYKGLTPVQPRVELPAEVPKVLKNPCLNHPNNHLLDYRNRLCRDCVKERARIREEKRLVKEQGNALKPPYDWHAPRPMVSKGGRLEKATAFIKEGKPNGEILRLTGMSKNTSAKLRRFLEKQNGGPFFCSCGRPATHKGMCPERINRNLLNVPI